jgi:hypothetical protein
MNPNIIYGLVDPRTLMVRYVGQSKNGLRRASDHGRESSLKRDSSLHKVRWIRQLQKSGLGYTVVLLQEATPDKIDNDERWWIAYGRACGWPLTNLNSGGRNRFVFSAESLAKMSAARRGRPLSEEHRARIGAAGRGRKASKETIQRMREAQRVRIQFERDSGIVRKISADGLARLVAANLGRKMPPESIEKTRAAHIGRKASLKARQNMSAAKKGKPLSDKQRISIENASRISWASNLGSKRSEESKARMRQAWERRRARELELGFVRVVSEETRARIREGKKRGSERRAAQRAAKEI